MCLSTQRDSQKFFIHGKLVCTYRGLLIVYYFTIYFDQQRQESDVEQCNGDTQRLPTWHPLKLELLPNITKNKLKFFHKSHHRRVCTILPNVLATTAPKKKSKFPHEVNNHELWNWSNHMQGQKIFPQIFPIPSHQMAYQGSVCIQANWILLCISSSGTIIDIRRFTNAIKSVTNFKGRANCIDLLDSNRHTPQKKILHQFLF